MSGDALSRTVSGWIRACMAASAVLDAIIVVSVALFGGGPAQILAFTIIMAVFGLPLTFVLICLLSGIPAVIVISLGEWLAMRSVFFYAGAGSAIGALIGAFIFPKVLPPVAVFAVVGSLAGIVYWFSAGRSAGNQRGDDPAGAPLRRLPCSGTSPRSCAALQVLRGH
ncbi:hypothetical protein PMI42_06545 [Bradyrhizobium sp. YR681]|nr:hypothetical protein PMI42_06545 [Bradyrhizobium sp. YR681]